MDKLFLDTLNTFNFVREWNNVGNEDRLLLDRFKVVKACKC